VKRTGVSFSLMVSIGFGCLIAAGSRAQEKPKAEPAPSYAEEGPHTYRRPGIDTDVSLYINHWRNSSSLKNHNGLIERDILTRGDPLHPPGKGAVLKYIKSYKYAVLPPHSNTVTQSQEQEQAFIYISTGQGRIEAGGKRADLEEGNSVFVPAGLEYRFVNPSGDELEMFIVAEETTPGFIPNAEISVGSWRDSKPVYGAHWAHIAHSFLYDVEPRFCNPMGFIVVSIDSFDIAQPHTHGPGTEEIWLQLRGRSLLYFGNRLLPQEPGEAFLVPPNYKVPHCSINHSGEPMLWLYMGCRHEEDAR
jgi:mannose-6-phosphate isomerase-like protein (cupin superfamily)